MSPPVEPREAASQGEFGRLEGARTLSCAGSTAKRAALSKRGRRV